MDARADFLRRFFAGFAFGVCAACPGIPDSGAATGVTCPLAGASVGAGCWIESGAAGEGVPAELGRWAGVGWNVGVWVGVALASNGEFWREGCPTDRAAVADE